jgi:hypothetical protein
MMRMVAVALGDGRGRVYRYLIALATDCDRWTERTSDHQLVFPPGPATASRGYDPVPFPTLTPRLEELEAHGATDDELIVRVALARRLVHEPGRAVHEAQVLAEVLDEIRQAVEWDAVPETAATPAPEQALAHHSGDRTI